jgi:hypothetical protein
MVGTIDVAEVAKLKAEGLGASEIARRLGIARASVYRVGTGSLGSAESIEKLSSAIVAFTVSPSK